MTRQDLVGLQNLQNQTVLVVKAPEETRLEVPAPTEVSRTAEWVGPGHNQTEVLF